MKQFVNIEKIFIGVKMTTLKELSMICAGEIFDKAITKEEEFDVSDIIHIKVPYYNHPCAWVDCTHKRGFTKDSLDDFSIDQPIYGTYVNTYPKFKITKKLNPGAYGKFIPTTRLRLYLSYAFGMILKEIEFKLEVIK
jgi:hypothetical protein